MSYILPAGSLGRTKNKWGLGGYSPRGMRAWALSPRQRARLRGGLGDDFLETTDMPINGTLVPPTISPIELTLPSVDTTSVPITGGLIAPTVSPIVLQPGVNPSIDSAYKNLLTQQQNSQSPLDYVSPQAAIAAGLPPQSVYSSWSSAIAKFPTQTAALAAGIPAGVVTQLWAQSRTAVPVTTSWFDQQTFGVSNKVLAAGIGGILLLTMAGGRGRR